jgi:hypothetical protein
MERIMDPVTRMEYALGYSSFIPVLGLILGTASIVLGCMKIQAGGLKLVVLGLSGILFNVMIGFMIHHHMIVATQMGLGHLGASMPPSTH